VTDCNQPLPYSDRLRRRRVSSVYQIGGNVFSAVAFPTVRGKGSACPEGAGPGADPLGPCMPQPKLIKQALDEKPPGARALTLEAGPGIYYLYDENQSVVRYGAMNGAYYMDTLAGAAKVQGPWADVYEAVMTKRVDTWFGELKRIGGKVDLILSDFEMGDKAESFNWVRQPTADGSDPVTALLADPRWPALRAQLNARGKPYGVSFDDAAMKTMKDWTSHGWRMHVWFDVVTQGYVAVSEKRLFLSN
jgi:hypothetical protein